jgi:glycosyltransferase involved in cell wall biosynthesis
MRHIVIIGPTTKTLLNFRGHLISDLVAEHYKITVLVSEYSSSDIDKLNLLGAKCEFFQMKRGGLNPLREVITFFSLINKLQKLKPNLVLAYTIKPVIWGGLSCLFVRGTSFIALITGLGYSFEGTSLGKRLLTKIASILYAMSLNRAKFIIFQNADNLNLFISKNICSREKSLLILGSGVDKDYFQVADLPNGDPIFLMVGRILRSKGILEYIEAARLVKQLYPSVSFHLLGSPDNSYDAVPMQEVHRWHDLGVINYLGFMEDVRPAILKSHIFVLPSYHEGLPRATLEAMSMGRPILTTNVPGCRETVLVAKNGYLAEKANSNSLATLMIWFIENRDQWKKMGSVSRSLVNKHFDISLINRKFINLFNSIET